MKNNAPNPSTTLDFKLIFLCSLTVSLLGLVGLKLFSFASKSGCFSPSISNVSSYLALIIYTFYHIFIMFKSSKKSSGKGGHHLSSFWPSNASLSIPGEPRKRNPPHTNWGPPVRGIAKPSKNPFKVEVILISL